LEPLCFTLQGAQANEEIYRRSRPPDDSNAPPTAGSGDNKGKLILDATVRDISENAFWQALDKLVAESKIVIDRPKGSHHPKYSNCVYLVDYGYLEETASMDGGGIDVWKGTDGDYIDVIICTVDLLKRDSGIKVLIGCTEEEKQLALPDNECMKSILIRRDTK